MTPTLEKTGWVVNDPFGTNPLLMVRKWTNEKTKFMYEKKTFITTN